MNDIPTVIASFTEMTSNITTIQGNSNDPIIIVTGAPQDNFQIGNYVGNNLPEEKLVIIDGEFARVEDQKQNQGFDYNLGIFATND
jgi:hypothetical protein